MAPFYDLGRSLRVLQLHCVANVAEFAVLEDQEAMSACETCEFGAGAGGGVVVPIVDEIVVRF